MRILKNRTILGLLCIAFSLTVCFLIAPLLNLATAEKTPVVRVTKELEAGDEITAADVAVVQVGAYNLPGGVFRQTSDVIGRFATANLAPGDYILPAKIADTPASANVYLYALDGSKQAISVTIKTLALGLSGKLQSGDIVSVIAPDYKRQGVSVIPSELRYVEVISVTDRTGYDANTATDNGGELPATVTLLVSPEQGCILAELESDGKLHLSLVYRGDAENAGKFITAQDETIAEKYHADSEVTAQDA